MAIARLAISNFRVHRVRVALTVAAVALSVSLVVSVTGGYASLQAAAHKFLARYLGSTDAQITRQEDSSAGGVPERLVDELRQDQRVKDVAGRLERQSRVLDAKGEPAKILPNVIGIRRPGDTQVESMDLEAGAWFDGDRGDVAVVDQVVARTLDVEVGDSFALPGINSSLKLKVVGIVHKPDLLARHMQTIYVPLRTLQEFVAPGQPPQVSRVLVDLHRADEGPAFAEQWRQTLAQIDPLLKLRLASESQKQVDQNLQGMELASYLGGTVAMLAAAFIVFSALSMGVAERTRTLAMLRAVGMLRWQVAALVVLEGLILAAAGVMVGVPLGWLWLVVLSRLFPLFFSAGVLLSAGGVALGALGSLAIALAASLLPAWSATRVSPLEAMGPLSTAPSRRVPLIAGAAGLLLIALDPLLMHGPFQWLIGQLPVASPQETTRLVQFYGHFAIGLPGIMLGFFLLAPLGVWLVERGIGPLVARLLGLRFALLRQQLSGGGMWRAAGTSAALMVGLAALVVMQTHGRTMLSGWRLPDKFPDIFIVSPLRALGAEELRKIETVEGIRPGEVMPIAIASPELGTSIFSLGATTFLPDATMFVGIDPDRMLTMMELDFVQGSAADAVRRLKQGRHVIITNEFHQLKGLGVGDALALKTPGGGTVPYTIAGVVWSPGIEVIVSVFDMGRQFEQRTVSSVIGTIEDARQDFGAQGVQFFAANLQIGVSKEQVLEGVRKQLNTWGLLAGDVRKIKYEIQQTFGSLLLLSSTVAFAALGVASLGVTNTIMASIRSRRWQFGILRSVGVTRSQLLRLVLGEALLLGLLGSALGLAAGMEMAINASAFSGAMVGYSPPITVPWGIVLFGVGVVMAVSLLASLWPATSIARAEPLSLLQAGRASA